ncbi:hypothetical protein ID866_5705 [Astraeus odoratus]|nr:hypothetical protein ID866_5705 [Astraeus odoratus]
MILPDEDTAQRIKDPPVTAPTIRYPERAASRRPCSPLPDYETSQALTYSSTNGSSSTLYKPIPRRRFLSWRAVLASLAVYIFLTLVIGIPIILKNKSSEEDKNPSNSLSYTPPPWPGKSNGAYFTPNLNNITGPGQLGVGPVCNNWTVVAALEGESTIQTWVEQIVSSTGQFSFTSNASYATNSGLVLGDFYVGVNPDQTVQNTTVSIKMQASSSNVFDGTFVCFALSDNVTDLSLYVPGNLSSPDNILFNITVLFPQSPSHWEIDVFSTFLPMFDQHFGSLEYLTFKKISIEGPTSVVTAEYLSAKFAFIETSMQPIAGEFHVTDSLVLSTVMAPIEANITLHNDPKAAYPTFVDLDTGNSNLTTLLTLMVPDNGPPPRPNFVVDMRTFYGALNATVVHDPSSQPAMIKLHAKNGIGPTNVVLDEKFQGIFQVNTKEAAATVSQGTAVSIDPWDSQLQRNIVTAVNDTARMDGWIGWGAQPACDLGEQGEVTVATSLADASLYFLG